MALTPARLVRAVEPPPSSPLSPASVCNAAGAYPHFSLFFFHSSSQRRSFSVSASVLQAQNFRARSQGRHVQQFRRQADEAVPFDDLQTLYGEERIGPSHHPQRNLNERGCSVQKDERGDGNRTRKIWEPSKYSSPWKKHGVPEDEASARYDKPVSLQGARNASSWTSPALDDVGEAYNGRSRQTLDGGKSRNHSWGTTRLENKSRQGNAYSDKERRSASFQQKQGNSFQQDGPRYGTSWQQRNPPDSRSPWEGGGYQESRGNTAWHPQKQFDRASEGERYTPASPDNLCSSSNETTGGYAGIGQEFDRQTGEVDPESISRLSYGVMDLQPSLQRLYSMQSNANQQREELPDTDSEAKAEFVAEPKPGNSSTRGMSPISRIMQKLRNVDNRIPQLHAREGVHFRNELAAGLALPSAREYLSDRSMPQPLKEQSEQGPVDTRFPWEMEKDAEKEDSAFSRARKLKPLSTAELTIPGPELRRLRILALHLKQRVKIGKHGVTKDLVNGINQRFQTCEVVKVKCEGPPAGNMKQTLETLEKKTGGFIIWKAGSAAVIYRGQDYGQPVSEIVDDLLTKKYQSLISSDGPQKASSSAFPPKPIAVGNGLLQEGSLDSFDDIEDANKQLNSVATLDDPHEHLDPGVTLENASKQPASRKKNRRCGPEFDTLEEYVKEMEDILKDLGPRYDEWTGSNPVPVDADLLPYNIPNYAPPYRVLPFGFRPSISNTLATHLRRLSRPLAPHFVIGRDRGLQGLAAAMVKLWERSEIAKIGIKRGILNTNHERIAEDLKQLTGGFFLCRDKYSMTFFRGKDFLPQKISVILAERQTLAQHLQVEEEKGRADGSISSGRNAGSPKPLPSWVTLMDPEQQVQLKKEAAKSRRVQIVAHFERKLKMALQKREKAEKELNKVEELLKPVASSDDKENLTEEERFMLRKLGLKMKAFLLVGRRGVFSGVVQNMHLHWKHRELVKIVIKERDPAQLHQTARMLEAESGGTLISVDPTSKGFAIVVYRGKNYTRPPQLRPANLLTKRLALRRSMEMQRRDSLTRHIEGLEQEIVHIRAGMSKMKIQEKSDDSALSDGRDNVHGPLMDDGLSESQSNQSGTVALTGSQGFMPLKGTSTKETILEDKGDLPFSKISGRKLRLMAEVGPIFRAERLSRTERHTFRKEVFSLSKAAQFHVGRSNPLSVIAKSIRLHFLDHAFVKIGVCYRPRGTSVQDVVEELEDLTGGTAYAQDDFKVVLYRGWPSGEDMPLGGLYDVLTPEQCDILEEGDDEHEIDMKISLVQIPEGSCGEVSNKDEAAVDKGNLQWDRWSSEEHDKDDDDEEGISDLRPENTSKSNLESPCEEKDREDLFWEKFSDEDIDGEEDIGRLGSKEDLASNLEHSSQEVYQVLACNGFSDDHAENIDDDDRDDLRLTVALDRGAGHKDGADESQGLFHEHMPDSSSESARGTNFNSLLMVAGNGAGADGMALDFDLDEDV